MNASAALSCQSPGFRGRMRVTPKPARTAIFLSSTVLIVLGAQSPAGAGRPIVVASPDGKVRAELLSNSGILAYRITVDGKQVLAPSRLGIRSDNVELGEQVSPGKPVRRSVNERYRFFGAHSVAVNRANESTVPVSSHGESYFVDIHVADDGVGVRLRLPARPGRKVQADRSSWRLDGDPVMWVDKLIPEYESPYHASSLSQLGTDALGLPITARVNGLYLTLTEAALKDYGDLGVRRGADDALDGELAADPDGWTTDDEVVQPWRVTIVARDLTALVNTTLVQNLNPPPDPASAQTEWIKPGRSVWQWMAVGSPRQDDQQQWVDWTSELGFEYYLIDDGWVRWKDAWNTLSSTVAYAKTRNVGVWLWVHSKEVKDPEARRAYFRKVADAGMVGVKIDFPPACNRWWSNWYIDAARDAAAFHLLLDFHGAVKPTGTERTWPNVLTREAIRGHEYHLTRYRRRLDPDHDVILPFTRLLAGSGDYTPTVFEPRELQGNTWGHELAQAIIFSAPFLCFGGHPKDYLANPARDLLSAIPPVWDETRVLPGSEPGKLVAMARRSGRRWFLAVINGADAKALDIPLDFLGEGMWSATELHDVEGKPDAWNRRNGSASKAGRLTLRLSPRGGFVGYFSK
jgi:alpha-glucosidase